jgi:hypothetical protein
LYVSHIKLIRSQLIADIALLFLMACIVPYKQPIKTENLSDYNLFLIRINPKPRAFLQGNIG